ncbi:hypothetical protein RI129_000276 [Pyrocoelia pectoralis]|uniref:Uncharacterized protein n=1 Tax=Pyrocoelia pectoralis TaxID=417401 RepID=A0AAN7ZPY1_9COLE
MSDNPESSTLSVKPRENHRKKKRKFSRTRLPTPPPDPTLFSEILEPPESPLSPDKDVHFFEYINSFPKIPPMQLSPTGVTEDAFDHLEKLYKLMEQMLNLRQQNAKLQRRVRDLEHLKNIQSMNCHLANIPVPPFEDIPELDDDSLFAESLLDTMLIGSKKELKTKPWARSRIRQSLMKKPRNRSVSVNEKSIDLNCLEERRIFSGDGSDRDKSSKVSKWTKVKAAFKWEKASPSVTGAKSQDSGIGGILPNNYEVARYLRVPSTTEDPGISPADSGAADGSTPASLSSASSVDDVNRQDHQISDDDHHSINLEDEHFSRESTNSSRASWFKTRNAGSSPINSQNKNRLSIRSDDIIENEDIRDHNENIKSSYENKKRGCENADIPEAIVERYKQALAENELRNKQHISSKGNSKWKMVKKAFLTPSYNHSTTSTHKHSSLTLASYKDNRFLKQSDDNKKIHEEIQKSYRQLQKKLSMEFQGKLHEWEKLKSQTATNATGKSDAGEDQKDHAFIKKMEEWQRIKGQPSRSGQSVQMMREENLAPEFKKKLEEWQRIKNSTKDDYASSSKPKKKIGEWPKWKSISGTREEPEITGSPPLSDEFIKKLEEWRKIKEFSKHNDVKEKTPSPRIKRKQISESSTSIQPKYIKDPDHKELHWFEKELNKIELEKRRLEEERDKFLQREEKLAKLRRTVMGEGNKKDVLIHTPSGFYKFEGISRKFTQKLCQWEKAQGIGPEASTFALLSSTFRPHITVDYYETDSPKGEEVQYNKSRIIRSKSAESVSTKNLIQSCPASHHPSSLSLNDVDELEKQMSLSRGSSLQDIDTSFEKLRNDEPEAVIVEIEDVEEETADVLEERLQEAHFAVYQREMALSTCEKQPCVVPYVQSIDFDGVQPSFMLIDKMLKLVKSIDEDQDEKRNANEGEMEGNQADSEQSPSPDLLIRKERDKKQTQGSEEIVESLMHLQELHSKYIVGSEEAFSNTHLANITEASQDLFSDLFQMVEQLQNTLYRRNEEDFNSSFFQFNNFSYSNITAITSELTSKLCELKRILSYFYAATDKTAPTRKLKRVKQRSLDSCESLDKNCVNQIYADADNNLSSKRMRYKKKEYCNKTVCESEDSDGHDNQDREHTKSAITVDPSIVEKLIIPTKPNFVNISDAITFDSKPADVLVKTTKKLFSPSIKTQSSSTTEPIQNLESDFSIKNNSNNADPRLPPLPSSPTFQRKSSKEISPGIRLMLAKYNQLISQQEMPGNNRSAGSSGSASPVAWRSPVSERRVKAQRDRYLEEVRKECNRYEVKKSASVNFLHIEDTIITPSSALLEKLNHITSTKGILRSTSASVIQNKFEESPKHPQLRLIIPEHAQEGSPNNSETRNSKIKKAKEEFLNSPSTPNPSSAPPIFPDVENAISYPRRSRFSQFSIGSESSCDSSPCEGLLVKSASAGMINVDEDTYRQIDPAFHQEGYVSLPRTVHKQKEGLLGGKLSLSNIAAKFRKVKMRKSRDQKKMNTVSALCRQSLVVTINSDNQESGTLDRQARSDSLTVPVEKGASSSDDTSPSSSRSGSWIRRSKIFKVL